jgi:dihydrofolate reductase
MRKLVLFMHVSLDGFVAGPNGEMDWIKVDDEIFQYASDRTNESDAALYGRVTYQMMDSYWPTAASQSGASKHDIEHSHWYNSVPKVILSRTMEGTQANNVKIISKKIQEEITKLKAAPGKDILMLGSPSAAHSLMQYDLIDSYWLFVNPILLGDGIPLFKGIKEQRSLKLVKSNAFTSGVTCLHYER